MLGEQVGKRIKFERVYISGVSQPGVYHQNSSMSSSTIITAIAEPGVSSFTSFGYRNRPPLLNKVRNLSCKTSTPTIMQLSINSLPLTHKVCISFHSFLLPLDKPPQHLQFASSHVRNSFSSYTLHFILLLFLITINKSNFYLLYEKEFLFYKLIKSSKFDINILWKKLFIIRSQDNPHKVRHVIIQTLHSNVYLTLYIL